jgi:hypothetical protein
MNETKGMIITLLITLVIGGFLVWAMSARNNTIAYFKDTDVACLINGHQNLAFHIHPKMAITVDGTPEVLPANIGITDTCMSEVHTHDITGEIHVESFDAERLQYLTLQHFFDVWGVSPERDGYILEIYLDGQKKESVSDIPFIDHSLIELKYTSRQRI